MLRGQKVKSSLYFYSLLLEFIIWTKSSYFGKVSIKINSIKLIKKPG